MGELSDLIQTTLKKISELKTPLEKVSTESEPQFIKIGNNLQDVFSGAEDLTTLTRETAMLIDGSSGENILANIGEFSQESLSKLNSYREDVTNILPKVETCATNLKHLYNTCPVIKSIAKKLNIVALHISMESSRSRECEEMFNFFVQEIKQLARKVHEVSIKIREDSEKANSKQLADFSTIVDRKDTLTSLADNAQYSVEDNIFHIEELIKRALKTMKRSETHAKKISSLVGEVVVAIQFHDIVRQQIEHIVQSLDEIKAFFNESSNGEYISDENRISSLAKAFIILSLQVEQLNQVTKEIDSAYKKIKRAFSEIGDEVDILVTDLIGFSGSNNNSNHTGTPFDQLISGLYQLEDILTQGREMAKMIDSNLRQSAETAESLTSHLTQMEDISMDLHIKAINALIMSKRLGNEGKTLSILAEDVTEVSMDSNEFVLDVVEILKVIRGLSTKLSFLSDEKGDYLNGDLNHHSLSAGINTIKDIYDDFLDKSLRSMEQSKGLRSKIIQLEPELEFLKEIENILSLEQSNINKIIESIEPHIPEDQRIDGELEHLSDRYTMNIERGIHDKVLKKGTGERENLDTTVSNNEDGDKVDENDFGENIELF